MKIPEGYGLDINEETSPIVLKLNKSIYGLVQAAQQWNSKFTEVILALGFEKNKVDPFPVFSSNKKREKFVCFVFMWMMLLL